MSNLSKVTQGDRNPGLLLCLAWDQGLAGIFLSLWPLSAGPFSEVLQPSILSPDPCSMAGVTPGVLEFRQVEVWIQLSAY